jgi:hypothetical protein
MNLSETKAKIEQLKIEIYRQLLLQFYLTGDIDILFLLQRL